MIVILVCLGGGGAGISIDCRAFLKIFEEDFTVTLHFGTFSFLPNRYLKLWVSFPQKILVFLSPLDLILCNFSKVFTHFQAKRDFIGRGGRDRGNTFQ